MLANAAHALAGMIAYAARRSAATTSPALGLTMFGVTTPCVQAVTQQLEDDYDCLVFHATGTGGQSMEKLVDSGLLAGVHRRHDHRDRRRDRRRRAVGAGRRGSTSFARTRMPYVGSCGALDMVNFWAMDTVPARFRAAGCIATTRT